MKQQDLISAIQVTIEAEDKQQLIRLEAHLSEGKSISMFLQSPSERALDETLYLTRQLLKQLESKKSQS